MPRGGLRQLDIGIKLQSMPREGYVNSTLECQATTTSKVNSPRDFILRSDAHVEIYPLL